MRKVKKINGFTPAPIYIVAAKLNKTPKTASAGCQNAQPKCKLVRGFSLVELMMAFAIIVIVFAAIVPQFRAIRNSWTGSEAKAGIIQNGRILTEHIIRNLSAAKKITTVTPSSTLNGYIVFVGSDGNSYRYQSLASYVRFGTVIPLRWITGLLAGSVNRFQIRCYSLNDLNNPTTDVNIIRLVQIETDFTNTQGPKSTFTASAYLQTNTNTDLVGWWKLDETGGTTAVDSSGNGNNGTLVNMNPAAGWGPGLIGGAIALDGSDDYVDLGTDASLNFGDSEPFTMAAWIKTTDEYGLIISFRNSENDDSDIDFAVGNEGGDDDPGKAMILVRDDGGGQWASVISETPVNDGQWHHVAAVRSSGSTVELFLDGVSQGTSSGSASGGAITSNVRAIGSEVYWECGGDEYCSLTGKIDDVRIYDRALTAAEIAQLANVLRYRDCNEAKAASD